MEPKKTNVRPRQSSLFKGDEFEINQSPNMIRSNSQTSTNSNASSFASSITRKPTGLGNYTPPRTSSMPSEFKAIPSIMFGKPVNQAEDNSMNNLTKGPTQLPKKSTGNIPKSTSNLGISRSNSNNSITKNLNKPISAFQTLAEAQPQIRTNVPQVSSILSPISPPSLDKAKLLLNDLESKSKPDLIALAKKLGSEINIKNRLINDAKADEKWLIAEIGVYKVNNLAEKKHRISELQKAVSLMATSNLEKNIIESLIVLKNEFDDAKNALEKSQSNLLVLEKMRTAAEQESAYLRSIMDPNNPNISAAQSQRIGELQNQLHETLSNYTALQAKISQWARASKRNQEGRVAAESIQSVLREDNQNLQLQLEEAIQAETATRLKYENLNDTVNNYDSTLGDSSENAAIRIAQNRIKGLESNMNQNYVKMENLEKENRRLIKSAERDSEEKKNFQKVIASLEKENKDLSYVLSSGKELVQVQRKSSVLEYRNASIDQNIAPKEESLRFEHELNVVMERLNHVQDDYALLTKTYQETLSELGEIKARNEKLESIIEENGDVIQKLNHATAEKKVLQGTLDNYAHKLQQKQLSIEMLEKHLTSAKERIAIMDQQAEDSEDLKYLLEDEKKFNLELQKKIQNLTLQSYANQDKINELSNLSKEKSSKNDNILEEELYVAKSMNDMLKLQLEEKKHDVEMLESRLKAQSYSKENRMSRNILAEDFKTDQLKTENELLKNDVVDAKSKLGQQLTTISKLEVLLGGCYEKIEHLETDKAKMSQKLALLESIKSDYESQREKYSKYEKKLLEMQQVITEQNAELSTKDDFIEAFENEVASLNDAMELFMSERDESQNEYNNIFNELRAIYLQFIDKSATIADSATLDLKEKVNDANNYLKEIKANLNAKLLKIESLESLKSKEESRLNTKTKSDSKLRDEEEDSNSKVWALVKQLEAEKTVWTKEKQNLENILKTLRESSDKQIVSLKDKIQSDEKLIMNLQINHDETSEDSSERTKKMEMALSEYQNAVKLLQEDLADLESERAKWEQREQELLAMNNKFEQSLRKEMNEVENLLNGEISALKIKLLTSQTSGDSNAADGSADQSALLIEIERYKSEIASLKTRISELEKMKEELENAVEYQGGIAEDALQQIDEYEQELIRLRSANHNNPIPGQKSIPGIIEELQHENENLKFHNEELIDQNEKLQAVVALLKDS